MPELPEVETVRQALEKAVTNKKIIGIYHGNIGLRFPFPYQFKQKIIGKTFLKPRRIGKYCILPLDSKQKILLHLGMSGKIRILGKKPKLGDHDHMLMYLEGEIYILLTDPRRFGFVDIIEGNEKNNKFIKKLGPEALSNSFTGEYFYSLVKYKERNIKSILLDQSIVAGLGNIYVNEVLFTTGISPKRKGKNISLKKCYNLVKNIKALLLSAIKEGGTTIKDHLQPDGSLGYFKIKLRVYGKTKSKCNVCGFLIKEVKQLGRTSFYCGKCQS